MGRFVPVGMCSAVNRSLVTTRYGVNNGRFYVANALSREEGGRQGGGEAAYTKRDVGTYFSPFDPWTA